MNYSNPTLKLVIDDYPLGGSKRGPCTFEVQKSDKGERVSRLTFGKPKFTTYADRYAIVAGEDGRTYILADVRHYGHITIYRSDFKCAPENGPSRDFQPERYAELLALIDVVHA